MPFVSTRPALQLTKEEIEDLEKASKSRTQPQRTVERAKILLEYYRHKSISQIARELETNRPKVERVINKSFRIWDGCPIGHEGLVFIFYDFRS